MYIFSYLREYTNIFKPKINTFFWHNAAVAVYYATHTFAAINFAIMIFIWKNYSIPFYYSLFIVLKNIYALKTVGVFRTNINYILLG